MIATVVTGGVAQLVERLNGIQKVRGSIPLTSTQKSLLKSGDFFLLATLIRGLGHLPVTWMHPLQQPHVLAE